MGSVAISNLEESVLNECNGEYSIDYISKKLNLDFTICLDILREFINKGYVITTIPKQVDSHIAPKINVGIFSPHPDDAVLACGGSMIKHLIKNENLQLYIINVFSKENYSILPYLQKNEVMAENVIQQEEKTIEKALRCQTINLGFLDALLREYKSVKEIFYRKSVDYEYSIERNLISDVVKSVKNIINDKQLTYVLLPLAIGGHIDHLLTKESILNIYSDELDCKFYFYEDQPYAATSIYGQKQMEKLTQSMTSVCVNITESAEYKRNLLGTYKTQLTVQQINKVLDYSKELKNDMNYYERFWMMNKFI